VTNLTIVVERLWHTHNNHESNLWFLKSWCPNRGTLYIYDHAPVVLHILTPSLSYLAMQLGQAHLGFAYWIQEASFKWLNIGYNGGYTNVPDVDTVCVNFINWLVILCQPVGLVMSLANSLTEIWNVGFQHPSSIGIQNIADHLNSEHSTSFPLLLLVVNGVVSG